MRTVCTYVIGAKGTSLVKRSIRASGKSRAENWESWVAFFLPVNGQRHLKTKTDTAGDGICRHLLFFVGIWNIS